jgi:hypothetical protein
MATDTETTLAEQMSSLFVGAQFDGWTQKRDVNEAAAFAETGFSNEWFTPFGERLEIVGQNLDSSEAHELESLLEQLHDEGFNEALEQLTDEAAAHHLSAVTSWTTQSEAPSMAAQESEALMTQIANEADRLFEVLAEQFRDRTADTMGEGELESAFEANRQPHWTTASEEFFRGLVRKVGQVAKGAWKLAKKGIAAVGKILPFGKIFKAVGRLVRPLLGRVLRFAIGKLPVPLQPLARKLAAKMSFEGEATTTESFQEAYGFEANELFSESESFAESFDRSLAGLALAADEQSSEQLLSEAEMEGPYEVGSSSENYDATSRLDTARSKFVEGVLAAKPGTSPIDEMEQFLPAIMAVLPIVRMGIRLIGRGKVVSFLANLLAGLIKNLVGPEAAQLLANPIVDVGMRLLTLEAETQQANLSGAEAVASTIEATVRRLSELPSEAFDNELQLATEVHQAFYESAAEHLALASMPSETEGERGMWLLMPRAARPCYRYKKYSRVFRVPITSQTARAIIFANGETLEGRLLNAGSTWPVSAEVHLFETLPGTRLGHLAAAEGIPPALAAQELEALTPSTAGVLLGHPGLGRAVTGPVGQGGNRFMRIIVSGSPLRRHHRLSLRLTTTTAQPKIRVAIRLSEREAHILASWVTNRKAVQAVAGIRGVLGPAFRQSFQARLLRRGQRLATPMTQARAHFLTQHVSHAMVGSFATEFATIASQLTTQARDPRAGITLMFEFAFESLTALQNGLPSKPTLTVHPGIVHG